MNLHSNMVRFIIDPSSIKDCLFENLHSNMVRFIIIDSSLFEISNIPFTFQYG